MSRQSSMPSLLKTQNTPILVDDKISSLVRRLHFILLHTRLGRSVASLRGDHASPVGPRSAPLRPPKVRISGQVSLVLVVVVEYRTGQDRTGLDKSGLTADCRRQLECSDPLRFAFASWRPDSQETAADARGPFAPLLEQGCSTRAFAYFVNPVTLLVMAVRVLYCIPYCTVPTKYLTLEVFHI